MGVPKEIVYRRSGAGQRIGVARVATARSTRTHAAVKSSMRSQKLISGNTEESVYLSTHYSEKHCRAVKRPRVMVKSTIPGLVWPRKCGGGSLLLVQQVSMLAVLDELLCAFRATPRIR